jgi:uncharacterized protein
MSRRLAFGFAWGICSGDDFGGRISIMRETINAAMKDALRARDAARTSTLRLIVAAIKDREIAARGEGKTVGDEDILALLQKMVKQREESAAIYAQNARPELEAKERAEIAIIQEYLPKGLSEDEVEAAIKAAIAETGAEGVKDMGKVIGVLKAKYPGQIDFGAASKQVKAALGG